MICCFTALAMATAFAVLLAHANAQSTTVVNNPSDPGVVYSYYSICPTATTTTIILDTTTTICPGPKCGGMATYKPQLFTTVGPDGRTTVAEVYQYTAPCPCDGGICDAVYTVTRECPCNGPHPATDIPAGFTTAAVACHVCAKQGGPSTVTIITPASNGPYASQTPVMGTPYNGAYASAGPNGAVASAGASAVASAGSGSGGANANSNANAWASNSTSGSGSNSNSNANAGNSPGSNSTSIVPPITPYQGSADRAVFAVSAIFVGLLGSMAFLL